MIYVPSGYSDGVLTHVISHEKTHISHLDYLWKPIGFVILSLHWFNPILWMAYVLLCRDIELACDEKVIKELNNEKVDKQFLTKKFKLNKSDNLQEIEKFVVDLGEPKFRAKQLYSWIYTKFASDFDQMTDISKSFRENLKANALLTDIKIKERQISSDKTIKYLLEYTDGNVAECVLMRFDNRANLTACVSSQVGCAVNCSFCATGKRGFIRNLSYIEIIEQVLTIQRDTGLKVTNVVFMGQGEPLLNLDNVLKAIEIFNEDFQIGARRITVSTSGIIPKINELANKELQSTLAISLHAPTDELRSQIMPINNRYKLNEVLDAAWRFTDNHNRQLMIEYILLGKRDENGETVLFNATPEYAEKLSNLLQGKNCMVNLIPWNAVDERDFASPSGNAVHRFQDILIKNGIHTRIRRERGTDIGSACGQLRLNNAKR